MSIAQERIKSLEFELDDWRNRYNSSETELQVQRELVLKLELKIEGLQGELYDKEHDGLDKIMRLEGEIESLRTSQRIEIQDYKETIERLNVQIQEMTAENDELKEKNRELEDQIDNKSSSSSSSDDKVTMEEYEKLKKKIKKLED